MSDSGGGEGMSTQAELLSEAKAAIAAARKFDGESEREKRDAYLLDAWRLLDRLQHDPSVVAR